MNASKIKRFISALIGIILIFAIILFIYVSTKTNRENADKQAQFTLDEVVTLQKESMYSQLNADIKVVESLATWLEHAEIPFEQAAVTDSMINDDFKEIIIFDLDGYGKSTNGNMVKVSDVEFIESLKATETRVYESEVDQVDDYTIRISSPVFNKNGEVQYVVVGIYGFDTIRRNIANTFGKDGHVGIINSNGQLVFSNMSTDELFSVRHTYLETLLLNVKLISGGANVAENLEKGRGGSFLYEYNKEPYYCKYSKLDINDWFVIAHISKNIIATNYILGEKDLLLLCLLIALLAIYVLIVKGNSKKEIANLSLYDKLTGLPTGEKFKKEINAVLSNNKDAITYCVVFDICNFKLINDRFGNAIGDEMLRKIAGVMFETKANNSQGTVYLAKLYSDTFAILVVGLSHVELKVKAFHFLEKCREASRFIGEYNLNLSCGRYMRQKGDTGEIVLERALTAHAHSKKHKANTFVDYDNAFIELLHTNSDILDSFKKAMEDGEFQIYLQPQYKASNEKLSGAEVLVRWIKDGGIKYTPNVFIPVLEEAGRISELDSYLREQVCITIRKWLDEGMDVVPISLNVSRVELLEPSFVPKLLALVKKYVIPAHLLHIEITETAYVGDYEYLIKVVEQLSSHGFHVEMDDFGSGYSSLNVLKDIPINVVKLDMKFVEKGVHEARSGSILSSVVRMTQEINLITIAEGVETREQIDYLRSIGCDYMQGYYFARPMPLKEFEAVLRGGDITSSLKNENKVGINNAANFLNATAQETLLFNTFLGGAVIVEYINDVVSVIRTNDKFYEVFGQTRDSVDFFKYNMLDVVVPELRDYMRATLKTAAETGEEIAGECATIPLDEGGPVLWQQFSVRCLGQKGNRYTYYFVLEDITNRKKLEENLKAEIKKSQALVDSMPGGLVQVKLVDGNLRMAYASEGIVKRMGYTLEEMRAIENINMMIHPDDRERVQAAQMATVLKRTPFSLENRFIAKNGNTVWFSCSGSYTKIDENNDVFEGFFYDITALKEAREKVAAFVNNISDGYGEFSIRDGGVFTDYLSEGYCKLIGYPYEEAMTMHINEFAHPDDLPMIEAAQYNTIVNNEPFDIEYRLLRKDGSYIWMHAVGRYIRTDSSTGTFYGAFFDIDRYKSSQFELEELKQKFEELQKLNDQTI